MAEPVSGSLVTWPKALKVALLLYLPLRLGLSLFVAVLFWVAPTLAVPLRVELMARWGIPVPEGPLARLLLNPWLRYDALWYLKTAVGGYELTEPNIHHLPLYPLLIRFLYELVGGHLALDALFISNLAFIFGLAYFYRLVQFDYDEAVGWRSAIYLAIFPTAFFYLVGYTESLFLLGSGAAFYYARRQSWFRSGLGGAVSALARPQGVLILLPLVVEFLQHEVSVRTTAAGSDGRPTLPSPNSGAGDKAGRVVLTAHVWRRWLKAWPLLLIPLGLGLYVLYVQLNFGLRPALDADLAYWQMQRDWLPGLALWLNLKALGQSLHPLNNSFDLLFALFGLAMTIWVMRTLRPAYWLFMALNLLMVISRPIDQYPLLSLPRFVLPLFPMYILLGQVGQNSPRVHRVIAYTSLVLLLFFTAQFALGGWVA
ncbi:MAG: mannosyltransferase family protein [Chloroflexota bacterium]